MANNLIDEKVIIPKSNKKISVALVWNLNWVQVISITALIVLAVLLMTFMSGNVGIHILVVFVIVVIGIIFFILKIQGKIVYQYILIWFKWIHRHKNTNIKIISKLENITKINNKFISTFKINAESINFLSDEDKTKLLTHFWNLIKELDHGTFIKIPSSFNFNSYLSRLRNLNSLFMNDEQKIMNTFKKTQNLNEFYLIVNSTKEQTTKDDCAKVLSFLSSNFIQYENVKYDAINTYFDNKWNFVPNGFIKSDKTEGFIYQIRDTAVENNYYYLKEIFSMKDCFAILNFATIEQRIARKQLDNIVNKLNYNLSKTSKTSDSLENEKISDSIHEQLNSIVDNSDKFKNINLYVGSIGKTQDKLSITKSLINNVCNSYNFKLDKFHWEQDIALTNALTMSNVITRNSLNMTAKTLAKGYFLDKNQLNDPKGYLLGSDGKGNPVFLDLFKITKKRKHHNAVLFGTPGSGKTTLLLKMLKWNFENKVKIFLIDVEDEYSSWTKASKGQTIDLAGGKETINPLEIFANEGNEYQNYLSQQLINLDGFLTMLDPSIPKEAKEYILTIIRNMYLKLFKTASKNIKWFTFSDVITECKKDQVMYEKVYFYIEPIVHRFGMYWNKPTSLKITNENLVCVRLQDKSTESIDMPDSILSIQIFLITKYIDKIIYNARETQTNCLIVIDEAHKLVSDNNEFILTYLSNLAKRVRKYHTGLILATQNTTDFVSAKSNQKYFANIFKCMQYFFYGGMHAQDIASLDNLLSESGGLTESQKAYLTTAEKGQFILQIDNTNFIDLKVKITTNPNF